MIKPNGLLADLRRAYDALALANLGEYMPQHKEEVLRQAIRQASRPRIALAVQGRVHPESLRYASGACERMDADLDIVTDLPEGGLQAVIEPARERLAASGHRLEVISLGRDLLRDLVRYATARSGLLFVVVSADDAVAEPVMGGFGDSDRLDVPWVVVARASSA